MSENMRSRQVQAPKSEMEKNLQAGELKIKKKNSEKSISRLVDNYLDAEAKLGPDHFRTQMLKTFVDLVVPLKDVADTMLDMQEALGTVSSTISLIDDTMKFMYEMMNVSKEDKYTLLRRWQDKRKMKRFMKNNWGRMRAVMDSAMAMTNISQSLQESLGKLSYKIKKQSIKQKEYQEKSRKKKAGLNAVAENKQFFSSSSDKIIEERRKERGLSSPQPDVENKNNSSNDSSGGKPTGGIDDIVG